MTNQTNKTNQKKAKARPAKAEKGKGKPNPIVRNAHSVITGNFINKGKVTEKVLFILFIAALGLVYIANNLEAEKKIREIARITSINKELSFDHLRMKTKLNDRKRPSYLAEKLKPYGIKPAVTPPEKIFTNP